MPKIISNVRETLILEGRKFLLKKNYSNLNIREVCKSADISIGTFYNYFSNKHELVVEIFKYDELKIANSIRDLQYSNFSFKDKLFQIYLNLKEFMDNYILIFYQLIDFKEIPANSKCKHMINIYLATEELLNLEKSNNTIKSKLDTNKLSHILIGSLVYLTYQDIISFDDLYSILKI